MSTPDNESLETQRSKFKNGGIAKKDLSKNPIEQFEAWLSEAEAAKVAAPKEMLIATVGPHGLPSVGTVLLQGADSRGFRFSTNLESRRAREITTRPRVALAFHWKEMERQITVEGTVVRMADQEAEKDFRSLSYPAQIKILTSRQGMEIETRSVLDKREKYLRKRHPEGSEIPFPEFWGGFIVQPTEMEFWQSRSEGLDDRLAYRPVRPGSQHWKIIRMSP